MSEKGPSRNKELFPKNILQLREIDFSKSTQKLQKRDIILSKCQVIIMST